MSDINRGDLVIDLDKNKGIVVKIEKPTHNDDHGCIYVWQINRTNYGADNCEHYVYSNWDKHLRVIKK